MRINSQDRKSWVEVFRTENEGYSSYNISCNVDIGHGQFNARNTDIQLLNLESFIQDLDTFIISRVLRPKLEGTYDTSLEFYQPQSNTAVMLSFVVGDAYCRYSETANYRSSGSFEIEQEYLNAFVGDLCALV